MVFSFAKSMALNLYTFIGQVCFFVDSSPAPCQGRILQNSLSARLSAWAGGLRQASSMKASKWLPLSTYFVGGIRGTSRPGFVPGKGGLTVFPARFNAWAGWFNH